MYKKIACILLAMAVFGLSVGRPKAADIVVTESANLKSNQTQQVSFDYRAYTLRKYLAQHGSPLTPYSTEFIAQADAYGLDYRLVAAISGVESTFGKNIPIGSYNAYGWANGKYSFRSWPHSIQVVSEALKTKYIDKGAVSINRIAKIYAPPSTTWGAKVKYFVAKIDTLPLSFDI